MLSSMDRVLRPVIRRSLCTSPVKLSAPGTSAADIRTTFIDFFRSRDHVLVPSSPVAPDEDPTVSFVNSGMTQFKKIFVGEESSSLRRAVNSQKCIRIKGKHNDLSQVGSDGTHHTFFEMLGNWSFNDYFKEDACSMAWQLLTKVYGIPKERLYVTYFGGDEAHSLKEDAETREIWRRIGVPAERILPFGMENNFWEMGSSGPCGPSTEIHYDSVGGRPDASSLVNSGSREVIELWNLVFIQYNRSPGGFLERLGKNFVDTGMGFERLVSVIQGRETNYETDLFRPMFDAISRISGHPGYGGLYDGNEADVAYRIVADHARFLTVALSDGLLPNIHSRIRPVFRRAHWLSRKVFNTERGLLKELSNHVAESLSPAYPEVGERLSKVHYLIEREEEWLLAKESRSIERYLQFIRRNVIFADLNVDQKEEFLNGMDFIQREVLAKDGRALESEHIRTLSQTYGVPEALTEQIARKLGLDIDMEKYQEFVEGLTNLERIRQDSLFHQQAVKRKAVASGLGQEGLTPTEVLPADEYEVDEEGNLKATAVRATVTGILVNGSFVDSVAPHELAAEAKVSFLLDRTSLQLPASDHRSDSGSLAFDEKTIFKIYKLANVGGRILHDGVFTDGEGSSTVSVGDVGSLSPQQYTWMSLRRSHAAAQILDAVLRRRFPTVEKIKSFAELDRLTFDLVSYDDNFTDEELVKVEEDVNSVIREGLSITRRTVPVDEVRRLGNLNLKLGQTFVQADVTLAEMNGSTIQSRYPYSGLHLASTGDVGDFVIVNFSKGGYRIKRITARTGSKARESLQMNEKFREEWDSLKHMNFESFKSVETVKEAVDSLEKLIKRMKHTSLSYSVMRKMEAEIGKTLKDLNKYSRRRIKALPSRKEYEEPSQVSLE